MQLQKSWLHICVIHVSWSQAKFTFAYKNGISCCWLDQYERLFNKIELNFFYNHIFCYYCLRRKTGKNVTEFNAWGRHDKIESHVISAPLTHSLLPYSTQSEHRLWYFHGRGCPSCSCPPPPASPHWASDRACSSLAQHVCSLEWTCTHLVGWRHSLLEVWAYLHEEREEEWRH